MSHYDFPRLLMHTAMKAVFSLVLLGSTGLWITGGGITSLQELPQERRIEKRAWPNEPVEIMKILIKNAPVELGTSFLTQDDWLKSLKIRVKNVSNRRIKFIDLALEFPRPTFQKQELTSRDHLLYGEYPASPGQVLTAHPDQPPLAPGESVDLVLGDYKGTRAFLNERGYPPAIMALEIILEDVVFDDDTKYNGGEIYRRDRSDPAKWIPLREQLAG